MSNQDLEAIWQMLLATSRRQQQIFGYHILDDGTPVWDSADKPDEYAPGQYEQEQQGEEI